jgi:hypothetical protein
MPESDILAVAWRKSSFSASAGNCIKVAIQNNSVFIGDTKNQNREIISVSYSAWRGFIQAIQDGKAN